MTKSQQAGLSPEGRSKGSGSTKRPFRWSLAEIAQAAHKTITQVNYDRRTGKVDLRDLLSVSQYIGLKTAPGCRVCGKPTQFLLAGPEVGLVLHFCSQECLKKGLQ